jgi:hypothetical protein
MFSPSALPLTRRVTEAAQQRDGLRPGPPSAGPDLRPARGPADPRAALRLEEGVLVGAQGGNDEDRSTPSASTRMKAIRPGGTFDGSCAVEWENDGDVSHGAAPPCLAPRWTGRRY